MDRSKTLSRTIRLFVLFLLAAAEYFSLALTDGTIWNEAWAGASPKPRLISITPEEARNDGTVSTDVYGSNFALPVTLALLKNWRVIEAQNVILVDSTHIKADFPLCGVSPGEHELVVDAPGGQDFLKNAFLIKGSGHHNCGGDDDTVADDTADDASDDASDDADDDTVAADDDAGGAPIISDAFWDPDEVTWSPACETAACTELDWDVCDPDNDLTGGNVNIYEAGTNQFSFLSPEPIPWEQFSPGDASACENPVTAVLELALPHSLFTQPGTFTETVDIEVTDHAGNESNRLTNLTLIVYYYPTTTTTTSTTVMTTTTATEPPTTSSSSTTTSTEPPATSTTIETTTTTIPVDDDAADDDAVDDDVVGADDDALDDDQADDASDDDQADDDMADDDASDDAADDDATDDVADDDVDDDAVDDASDDASDDAADDDNSGDDQSDDSVSDDADDDADDDASDDSASDDTSADDTGADDTRDDDSITPSGLDDDHDDTAPDATTDDDNTGRPGGSGRNGGGSGGCGC